MELKDVSMPGPNSEGSKPGLGPKCQICQFVTACENFKGHVIFVTNNIKYGSNRKPPQTN